ncbi:N-acetylmuramoyl-L-alanine amidase [Winogradskyella epiphytica]|uniref:N-acetylmuramoyl-L-alanine amidase n=1 Tax=Winogradskyella epiphytica TaxID=262005 RepID=A0A2V4XTV8_9FLAO|nr:N-acetylmuramoyl-L-alanine amidase [Winogradskyella epiphytica]PYE81801.1 N-acetylmuramoyl-L-alanine amidase [Winogradskyella epiphytica]GGW62523.1 N-acetylmuramoyl-L-alanine amidase [Winogradskyella epiphytica]
MQTKHNTLIVFLTLLFIGYLTSNTSLQAQSDKFVVVLDAGHGGHDSGNVGNGYSEKNIALNITLDVGKELEKNPDIKVIYTRKTDVFIPLHERANIANKAHADLFVSIHCNAHHSQASGTETFVLGEKNTGRNFDVAKRENEVIFLEENYEENYAGFDPSSPESTIAIGIEQEIYVEQSIVLARKIEDNFIGKAKRKSRGLKQASLLVIRNTYMPSVLVEVGFLTNKEEGKYLNSSAGQTKMAAAIKTAVLDYKKELDQNVGNKIVGTNTRTMLEEEEAPKLIEGVIFKVQIAASSRALDPKPYNFEGLSDISREKAGNIYKYFSGSTSDYNEVKRLQDKARSKGFPGAFVVAYKEGKKISVSEALKSVPN